MKLASKLPALTAAGVLLALSLTGCGSAAQGSG